jgi:hypothetical protein
MSHLKSDLSDKRARSLKWAQWKPLGRHLNDIICFQKAGHDPRLNVGRLTLQFRLIGTVLAEGTCRSIEAMQFDRRGEWNLRALLNAQENEALEKSLSIHPTIQPTHLKKRILGDRCHDKSRELLTMLHVTSS